MQMKKVNLSTFLAEQRFGIKAVEDGIWLIPFMADDLGRIGLEQKTLQTIDNPLGNSLYLSLRAGHRSIGDPGRI
jgi:hypothetical protein